MDVLSYFERKAHLDAVKKSMGKEKCSTCHLFFCICQLSLKDWVLITHKQRKTDVSGCPHLCRNQGVKCLDCVDYNNYIEFDKK